MQSAADNLLTLSVHGSIELLQGFGNAARRTEQVEETSLWSGGIGARNGIVDWLTGAELLGKGGGCTALDS